MGDESLTVPEPVQRGERIETLDAWWLDRARQRPRAQAVTVLGADVVARNHAAVDHALEALHRVPVPDQATATRGLPLTVPADAPPFVQAVTAAMMAGVTDHLWTFEELYNRAMAR